MLHGGWAGPSPGTLQLCRPALTKLLSRCTSRAAAFVIICGDKKKFKTAKAPKKKKTAKKDQAGVPSLANKSAAAEPPPPPRIDTNVLPLKTYKRLIAKRNAEQAGGGSRQQVKITTAYRRRQLSEEERRQAAEEREEERRRARKYKGHEASFASLYGKRGYGRPPILLVDGYNVLGQLARGSLTEDSEDADLIAAFGEGPREQLQQRLVAYSHCRGVKVVLVWDAMGGSTQGIQRTMEKGAIDVVYCGSSEADSFIMLEVANLKEIGTPLIMVATNDMDLRNSINGAFCVKVGALIREMEEAERATHRVLESHNQIIGGTRIGERILAINPKMYEQLTNMRAGRGFVSNDE